MKISLDGSVTGDTVPPTMTKTHDNVPRIGNWPKWLRMPPLRRDYKAAESEAPVVKTPRVPKVKSTPVESQEPHALWDIPEGDF